MSHAYEDTERVASDTDGQPEAITPTEGGSFYRWELIALLWFAFFLNQGDRQAYGAVMPLIRDDLGLTSAQLGLVVTVFTIIYGLLVPVAGLAGDLIQKRWVVFASLFIFSTGTLLTGSAMGLGMLIIFRSLATGAGEAFYYPAANSLIGQYHHRSRAQAMAIHQTANYTGIVIGGWLAAWIGEHYGWRTAFYVFGIAGIAWSALLLLRLKNDRRPAPAVSPDAQVETSRTALRHALSTPTLYLLSLAFGGMIFVHVGFVTWMPTYLFESFDLSLSEASFTAMFYHHITAYAGVLIGARIADRLVLRRKGARLDVEFIGLLFGAPFIWLMGAADTYWLMCLGLLGFGFFRGVYDSNLFAALFDVIHPRYHSTATGVMLSIAFVVGSVSPLLLGMIEQDIGLGTGIAALAAVYVASAVVILIARYVTFDKDLLREGGPS
ncbi:MFS transporter [Aeoliella sp.]|uniref:MFS transporter n=1 Tax=Aeoliella sp. TaxID=2795800 RepID=UPI003CCC331D